MTIYRPVAVKGLILVLTIKLTQVIDSFPRLIYSMCSFCSCFSCSPFFLVSDNPMISHLKFSSSYSNLFFPYGLSKISHDKYIHLAALKNHEDYFHPLFLGCWRLKATTCNGVNHNLSILGRWVAYNPKMQSSSAGYTWLHFTHSRYKTYLT